MTKIQTREQLASELQKLRSDYEYLKTRVRDLGHATSRLYRDLDTWWPTIKRSPATNSFGPTPRRATVRMIGQEPRTQPYSH